MKKFCSLIVILIFLSSCVANNVGKYVPPNTEDTNFTNSVISNKNFDDTWTSVIDFVSGSFFNIENFEKDSGLLTLSFGSREAENFINCGDFEVSMVNGEEFKGSYTEYALAYLNAVLEARMNINIRKIDNESTKIRINTNYVFKIFPGSRMQESWNFVSGDYQKKNVRGRTAGTIPTRTCKSTNFAENAILNVIK